MNDVTPAALKGASLDLQTLLAELERNGLPVRVERAMAMNLMEAIVCGLLEYNSMCLGL
jgi:hypothetical protein